jgi:hypothetical protein
MIFSTLAVMLFVLDAKAMTQSAVGGYPFAGTDAHCFILGHPGVYNQSSQQCSAPVWVMPIVWQTTAYNTTMTMYAYQESGPTQVSCHYIAFNTDGSKQVDVHWPDFAISTSVQSNTITIPSTGPGIFGQVECKIGASQGYQYNAVLGLDYAP